MKRLAVLLYGVVGFLLTHLTVLYLIGFVGNLFVPKSIDGALQVPLWQALLTDTFLITVFCLQHSLMARPQFKKWWTQWIPEPIERSTYVIFTFLALGALFIFGNPGRNHLANKTPCSSGGYMGIVCGRLVDGRIKHLFDQPL